MITHSLFTTLDEIDFEALFASSLSRMDAGTYPWPEAGMTPTEKRAFILNHVQTIMARPNAFCFKGVEDDGVNVTAIFGTKTDDVMYGALSLAQPDTNGSRSYAYVPANIADMRALLAANGVTSLVGYMPKNSPLRQTIPQRHNVTEGSFVEYDRTKATGCDTFVLFDDKSETNGAA